MEINGIIAGMGMGMGIAAFFVSMRAINVSTKALTVARSTGGGIVDTARAFCKMVKANPGAFGYDSYCDFLNDRNYAAITIHCERNGCD